MVLECVVEFVELAANVSEIVEQWFPLFGEWCSTVFTVNLKEPIKLFTKVIKPEFIVNYLRTCSKAALMYRSASS